MRALARSGDSYSASQGWSTLAARLLLRLYRLVLAPLLGNNCRFEPSCSRYAEQALERFGLIRGTSMSLRRLLRCHPWNPGGYDPVIADIRDR